LRTQQLTLVPMFPRSYCRLQRVWRSTLHTYEHLESTCNRSERVSCIALALVVLPVALLQGSIGAELWCCSLRGSEQFAEKCHAPWDAAKRASADTTTLRPCVLLDLQSLLVSIQLCIYYNGVQCDQRCVQRQSIQELCKCGVVVQGGKLKPLFDDIRD